MADRKPKDIRDYIRRYWRAWDRHWNADMGEPRHEERVARRALELERARKRLYKELHEHVCDRVRISLPTDFEPYGQRSREEDWGPDCSCGCVWFISVGGSRDALWSGDWGVCVNPDSPRKGLLTWEHQGCKQFEWDEV